MLQVIRPSAILFDLDGTLTDPLEGIARSIQYALQEMGGAERSVEELAAYIGPPLRGTFALLLETAELEAVERALALYRERFGDVGLFENTVYDGILEALATLQAQGLQLYVATAKPSIYAARIIEHFGMAPYFSAVYGAELDNRFDDKAVLLAHLLAAEGLTPGETVMVGDRSHDIEAARRNGLRSIGVSYGYGSRDELLAAGADVVCATPAEIVSAIAAL